jgi:hypothetical protein
VPFTLAPELRSSLAPEVFRSLTAFVEPVSDQVQKLIYRHSGRLSFGRVKISENLGPGSASGAFSSVQLVLEPFPHTYRISTGRGDSLVSNSTFPQNNGRNLLISILHPGTPASEVLVLFADDLRHLSADDAERPLSDTPLADTPARFSQRRRTPNAER